MGKRKGRRHRNKKIKLTQLEIQPETMVLKNKSGRFGFLKKLKGFFQGVVTFLGILTLLSAYFYFRPSLSASSSSLLDPTDVFSSPIEITNEGVLDIFDIMPFCNISGKYCSGAILSTGRDIIVSRFEDSYHYEKISSGETATLICGLTIRDPDPMCSAEISIHLSFRPVFFWPFHNNKEFLFMGQRDLNGNFHWFQQPKSN